MFIPCLVHLNDLFVYFVVITATFHILGATFSNFKQYLCNFWAFLEHNFSIFVAQSVEA